MNSIQTLSVLSLFSLALTATASAGVVDQETYDVRLVAAQISGDVITIGEGQSAQIKPTSCRETGRDEEWHSGVHLYDNVTLDCSEAIAAYVGAPLAAEARIYSVPVQNGTLKLVNPGWTKSGRRIDLYTAVRNAALAPAAGIGFFSQWSNERFIPRAKLKEFTQASTWEGEAVTVQRFAAFFAGGAFDFFMFKPYIRYDDQGTEYKNWENLTPRQGSGDWTGGFGGSGNYALAAQSHETIRYADVIRELDRIPVSSLPAAPRVEAETNVSDVVTITHKSGSPVEAEVALFPYVHGVDLPWDPETLQVEAGKEVWFRYQGTAGQNVKLFYTIAGGVEQEAGYMNGGNCYPNFNKCFKIDVPADAHGVVTYRFSSGWAGQFTVAGQGAEEFVYDAAKAAKVLADHDVRPEFANLTWILTAENGEELEIPAGHLSTWRDERQQLVYRVRLAKLKLVLPEIVKARVKITAFPRGGAEEIVFDEQPISSL